jgi:hypothetical protein
MSTHPIPSAPLASILGEETRRGFPDNQPWTRVGTDQGGGSIAIIEHLIPPGASPWREQGCTLRPCHYAFRPRASPTASAPRGTRPPGRCSSACQRLRPLQLPGQRTRAAPGFPPPQRFDYAALARLAAEAGNEVLGPSREHRL